MHKATLALFAFAALNAAACAPTLHFNQSFLAAEDMRVSDKGFASLQSTGESFDLTPILKAEGRAARVIVLKLHGSYLLTGEGFKNLWRLWPAGNDEIHFKPIDDAQAPKGSVFSGPALAPAAGGKCAVFSFTRNGAPTQLFVTAGGDVDAKRCPDA